MPEVNKVEYYGTVLIDISHDTVTPSDLQIGVTAHDASGAQITGTGINGNYQNLDTVHY